MPILGEWDRSHGQIPGRRKRKHAVIEAPSALGHVPSHLGVARMPDALQAAGLAERLAARRAARVAPPAYSPDRDPDTLVMNPTALREYSILLADAVEGVLDAQEFPVVLGGDCSIILGTMLALKRRGRYGLLYIDGHPDFYQPEVNPINGAASASDLAFVTGRGPDVVSNIEGRRPLVRDDDVVVFGYRNSAAQVRHRSQPLPSGLMAMDRDTIRRLGVKTAADEAVRWLSRPEGPAAYWIHVDVDVLDASIMSAVDDPQPDGLSWDELEVCLHAALVHGRSVGLQVCLYNPDMDPDGSSGRGLVRALSEALAPQTS
jgi:arginase